jgi:SAM-dependent methyltransferase
MVINKTSMLVFNKKPQSIIETNGKEIYSFSIEESKNIDAVTVQSFGEEWTKFNQFATDDIEQIGEDYFDILPESLISSNKVALDLGCGTGRWASYIGKKIGFVECVDPSEAVFAAAQLLKDYKNVRISRADVDTIPFEDSSFDLVYSLGVLHHIPDTKAAMRNCVEKVKHGGYFLVYLYYSLDNRGAGYKGIFKVSNSVRNVISKMRTGPKKAVCDVIAATVYFPLARFSAIAKKIGLKRVAKKVPLSYYSDKSFWIMKNDALDRFGTPLEQRFSRKEIEEMMLSCGLKNITFSEKEPYWHAVGQRV